MTIILGIDPGSRITGYGLIEVRGKTTSYLDSGCIRTQGKELGPRLLEIFDGICELMDAFKPQEVAIEQVFVHQNPNSALTLGHARGAAMVAAASHRISVSEYTPRAVKQAVVGYGAAGKDQVQHMVMQILQLSRAPQADAADALAIAICHSHTRRSILAMRSPSQTGA